MVFDIIGGIEGPMKVLIIILVTAAAYLLGNVSTATILARAKGIDIKKAGSGNAGTTNATRVLGKKAGAITLTADICKGIAAVLIGRALGGEGLAMICALAVFLGHVWPVLFGFKGGKGVATAFGAFVALSPPMGFTALAIVVIGVLVSHMMSGGSLAGSVTFPLVAWVFKPDFLLLGTVIAVIVFIKHWGNIVRMVHGEEPRISIEKLRSSK